MRAGGKTPDDDRADWPSILALVEDDDRRAAIEHLHPREGRDSFLSALRDVDAAAAADLLAAGRRYEVAGELSRRPVVAVAGMLNAGKTSLVATFLSPQSRPRTLRGDGNAAGTHRFVLWLPAGWKKDDGLWHPLMDLIGRAVGGDVEMLADEPEAAHAQYNNRDGGDDALKRPLVATDTRLDDLGIGLLDCPDIVSDEAFGLGSPEVRRELLGKAATICSAFLVVASAESSRDTTLGDLLRIASDLMPGVPRMLAVNKVRPRQSPSEVFETFGPMAKRHGVERIYAAYDFEIPASRDYIPKGAVESAQIDSLPAFFALSESAADNPPAAIDPSRLMANLPDGLDRGELFGRYQNALWLGLRRAVWRDGLTRLRTATGESESATTRARDALLDASLEFFAKREMGEIRELRLLQNRRVVQQLSESFIATAPWYARWGVRMSARVRGLVSGARDALQSLTPSAVAEKTAKDLESRFVKGSLGGFLTPDRFVEAVDRAGGSAAMPHLPPIEFGEDSPWWRAAEATILRFERDGVTALDPRRLDEATAAMWAQIPGHKKLIAGLTPLAASTAAFAAVLLIPVDFGASAVGLASIPELLGALGITGYAALKAGDASLRDVNHQAARNQLADFHAVACDAFGVARPPKPPSVRVGGASTRLPESSIENRGPVAPDVVLPLTRMRGEFAAELNKVLPRPEAES